MYALQHHKNMTLEKWSQYPVDRQIFMIANEINRLKNNITASLDENTVRETMERALELLDITIASQKNSLQKELLRFREIFGELYLYSTTKLKSSIPEIEKFYRVLLFMNSKTSILN